MAFRHFNQRLLKTALRPRLEESVQILPRAKPEETATNSLKMTSSSAHGMGILNLLSHRQTSSQEHLINGFRDCNKTTTEFYFRTKRKLNNSQLILKQSKVDKFTSKFESSQRIERKQTESRWPQEANATLGKNLFVQRSTIGETIQSVTVKKGRNQIQQNANMHIMELLLSKTNAQNQDSREHSIDTQRLLNSQPNQTLLSRIQISKFQDAKSQERPQAIKNEVILCQAQMQSNNKQTILQETILSREGSIQAGSMESFFGLNQTEITSQHKLNFSDSVVSLHSDGERMSKTNEFKEDLNVTKPTFRFQAKTTSFFNEQFQTEPEVLPLQQKTQTKARQEYAELNKQRDKLLERDTQVFVQKLKYRKLLNALFVLPIIIATDVHVQNSEDQAFAQGCKYMLNQDYSNAISCFKYVDNEIISEYLSSSGGEQMPQETENDTLHTSFSIKKSQKQDIISTDTDLKKKRLPKKAFELQNLRTEEFKRKRLKQLIKSPIKVSNAIDATEYLEMRRQMCYFNISVCFAKCGYITKAQEALKCVIHDEFQLIKSYNKAIFELLQKSGSLQSALKFLKTSVCLLEESKPQIWLDARDLKQSLTFCLVIIKQKITKGIETLQQKELIFKQNLDKINCLVVEGKNAGNEKLDNQLVNQLLFRVAKIPERDWCGFIELNQSKFKSLLKYFERENLKAKQKLIRINEMQGSMHSVKRNNLGEIVQLLSNEKISLPFTNRVRTTTQPVVKDMESSPMRNEAIKKVAAEQNVSLAHKLKNARKKMAEKQNQSKQGTFKLNHLNQLYLGINITLKDQSNGKLHSNEINNIFGAGLGGMQQIVYKQTGRGDIGKVRSQSEIKKCLRVEKTLKKIDKMTLNDIKKEMKVPQTVVETNEVYSESLESKIKINESAQIRKCNATDIQLKFEKFDSNNLKHNLTQSRSKQDQKQSNIISSQELSADSMIRRDKRKGAVKYLETSSEEEQEVVVIPSRQATSLVQSKEEVDDEDSLKHEVIYNQNFIQVIEQTYSEAILALYKLNQMLEDPQKFRKLKLNYAYDEVATKIIEYRNKTGYNKNLLKISKTLKKPAQKIESHAEIMRSLKKAFDISSEVPFYTEKLRKNEVETILDYKAKIKKRQIVDFYDIFKSLSKLSWFKGVSYSIQQLILARAAIRKYAPEEILVSQGQNQTNVFVILRGSVQVSTIKQFMGREVQIILKSLYDGNMFGEIADYKIDDKFKDLAQKFFNEQKYTYTVQEESCIMVIDKKDLNALRQNNLADEFAERLQFLESVDIFQDVQIIQLLPIAHSAILKKYKLGQFIIAAGEIPQGLYLIKSGSVKVGIDELKVSEIKNWDFSKNKPKPEPIKLKGDFRSPMREFQKQVVEGPHRSKLSIQNMQNREFEKDVYQQEFQIRKAYTNSELRERIRIFQPQTRKFDKDLNLIAENETAVQQFIEYFTLQTSQHFGGRVLFDDINVVDYDDMFSEERLKTCDQNIITRPLALKTAFAPKIEIKAAVEPIKRHNDSMKKMNNYGQTYPPAVLSVVADAAEVEVLIIDKLQMSLFPETIQNVILDRLRHMQSLERPFTKNKLKKFQTEIETLELKRDKVVTQIYMSNFYKRTGCSNSVDR